MAEELSQRMEMATVDLGRRVSRLFRVAREQAAPPQGTEPSKSGLPALAPATASGVVSADATAPAAPAMPAAPAADVILRELGGFASILDGIELRSAAAADGAADQRPVALPGVVSGQAAASPPIVQPPSSVKPRPPGPVSPRPRRPDHPSGPPPPDLQRGVVVVELPRANGTVDPARRASQLRAEMMGAAARTSARVTAEAQVASKASADAALVAGGEMELPVMNGSQRVGSVHARFNLERMLLGVLSLTRRDQGEIPFAIDGESRIHTEQASDLPRLDAVPLVAKARQRKPGPASDGEWVVVTRRLPSGVLFGIARPIGESLAEIRRAAARSLGLGLGFIGLAFLGVLPLATRMTRSLTRLTEGVDRIARGDLSSRVEVTSTDEIGALATSVNRMAGDLATHERLLVERERMRRELELSRQIQIEMLPRNALRLGVAEVKGVSIPAREVGGDFFNYFALPDGQLALLVGDVSGKGISAALLMANIQATLRARLPVERDLGALTAAIDVDVAENTPPEVYLTLFVGILDQRTSTLRYVNAGHNPQFVLRADGRVEELSSSGMPVGLLSGHGYTETSVALAEGDLLFFYTDGTVEITNEAGEFYGPERLAAAFSRERGEPVDVLLARIEDELRAFRGSAEPSDDATMMALTVGRGLIP